MPSSKKKLPRKAADKLRRVDIENCEFSSQCTARWGDMKSTKIKSVRRCGDCQRDAHYCATYDELKVAVGKNYCVAVDAADRPDHRVMGEMFPLNL
jgi:hypothetical protein